MIPFVYLKFALGCSLLHGAASSFAPEAHRPCLEPLPTPPRPATPVRLNINSWTSSRISAHIAAILLEERLGVAVELVEWNAGGTLNTYEQVAIGNIDIAVEVWLLGKEKEFGLWADEGASDRARAHAYQHYNGYSQEGITSFDQVDLAHLFDTPEGVAKYSRVRFAEGDAESKEACLANPELGCDADGIWRPTVCKPPNKCTAQVLKSDPFSSAGMLEGIIQDLRVPLEIAHIGAPAMDKALVETHRRRITTSDNVDLLANLYFPRQFVHGVDMWKATHQVFLDLGEESVFSAHMLHKLLNPRLELNASFSGRAPDIAAFVRSLQYRDEDWMSMMHLYEKVAGIPDREWRAACVWVRSNRPHWEPWIQFPSYSSPWLMTVLTGDKLCFKPSDCFDGKKETCVASWALVVQLAVAGWLLIPYDLLELLEASCVGRAWRKWRTNSRKRERSKADALRPEEASGRCLEGALQCLRVRDLLQEHQSHEAFMARRSRPSLLCSHVRSFDNFRRRNTGGAQPPPPSPRDTEGVFHSGLMLMGVVFRSPEMRRTILSSAGWALLAGSVGTHLHLLQTYHRYLGAHWHVPSAGEGLEQNLIAPLGAAFGHVTGDYKFYVTFALLGLISVFVKKWGEHLTYTWCICGRLIDAAICVGAAIVDPSNPPAEQLAWRFYRYGLSCLAIFYADAIEDLRADPVQKCVELGLLTPEEAAVLAPAGQVKHLLLISWLSKQVYLGKKLGVLPGIDPPATAKLLELRQYMHRYRAIPYDPQASNHWFAVVQVIMNSWTFLLILGAPFRMYMAPNGELQGFAALQVTTSLGLFFVLFCFWGTLTICRLLEHPFEGKFDVFNLDATLAATDESIFQNLRCAFDPASQGPLEQGGRPPAPGSPRAAAVDVVLKPVATKEPFEQTSGH